MQTKQTEILEITRRSPKDRDHQKLNLKSKCPICGNAYLSSSFHSVVPTLQNRVYDTLRESTFCCKGTIDLMHCNRCDFTFNGSFDNNIIVYDEKYDNGVPSKIFTTYYQAISRYVYEKYDLEKGVVYDIGCGKGTFLKVLCSMYPQVTAVGIDPSYEGDLHPESNLEFIQDFFTADQVKSRPSLILSRHVFEHIEFPKQFLATIREPIKSYPEVPFFFEVPDFNWIVKNRTFWDLCYEHCNYFSKQSISQLFNNPWSVLSSIENAFNEQYLWIEGLFNSHEESLTISNFSEIGSDEVESFVNEIDLSRQTVYQKVRKYKNLGCLVIVWGMATKGVIFTLHLDGDRRLFDYCIDINPEKQNKYAPLSGHLISDPRKLNSIAERDCLIVVMNPNYFHEIVEQVSAYSNIRPKFIDAHGNELTMHSQHQYDPVVVSSGYLTTQ